MKVPFKKWEDDSLTQIFLRVRENDPWDMIYEMDEFIRFAEVYVGVSFGWEVKVSRLHLAYYERTEQLLPAYYFDIDEWREHKKASWLKHPWPKDPEWVLTSLDKCIQYESKNGKTLKVRNREQWVLEHAIYSRFLEKPRSHRSKEWPSTVRIYLAGQAKDLRKVIERDFLTYSIIKVIDIWGEIPKEQWVKLGNKYRETYLSISDLVGEQFRTRKGDRMRFYRDLLSEYEGLRKEGMKADKAYSALGQKYYLSRNTIKTYLSRARRSLSRFDPLPVSLL